MIQSTDCCFFGNEFMDDTCRYPDISAPRYAYSKVGEIKKREKKELTPKSTKEKKRQGQLTTKWLKQNFYACPDICLPREIVYEQYIEFCRKEKISPACKATFGKLIRNTFPEVSSKRLGARGHSKYHYNGIGIKESSKFRSTASYSEGVTRFSAVDSDPESNMVIPNPERTNLKKFTLSSKIGTLLPNFPDVKDLVIPLPSDKTKMSTFILMYKTHCQCLVDVVISGNFEEIRLFLLHFWQGFPEHLMSLRTLDVFLDVVAFCDSILYRVEKLTRCLEQFHFADLDYCCKVYRAKLLNNVTVLYQRADSVQQPPKTVWGKRSMYNTLLDVLIPSVNYDISERLLRSIHNIGTCWSLWVQCSLDNMPEKLLQIKMAPAKRFCRSLKRCVAFLHLVQVNRPLLMSDAPLNLQKEIEEFLLEFEKYNLCSSKCGEFEYLNNLITKQAKELQDLFKKCTSVHSIVHELDRLILRIENWEEDESAVRNFVFSWIYMLSKISYVLSDSQTKYFTAFHLLSSLFQDYILLASETKLDKEQEKYIDDRFSKHLRNTGRSATDYMTSSTSSCLSNTRNPPNKVHKSKEKLNKVPEYEKFSESHISSIPHHSSIETYSNTWPQHFRRSGQPYLREMPSCKYAANAYHTSSQYGSHLSSTRDDPNMNGLSQHVPVYFPSNHNSQSDRISSSIRYSQPEFELNQFERNSCLYKTTTNQEYYLCNQR